MAGQKFGGEIHDVLIAGVVHTNHTHREVPVGSVTAHVLDLLIRRPKCERVGLARIVKEEREGNQQARNQQAVFRARLQIGKAQKDCAQPERRWQHQSADAQENQNSDQTPQQVPRVRGKRTQREIHLATDDLAKRNKDKNNQQKQSTGQQHSRQKVDSLPGVSCRPDFNIGG